MMYSSVQTSELMSQSLLTTNCNHAHNTVQYIICIYRLMMYSFIQTSELMSESSTKPHIITTPTTTPIISNRYVTPKSQEEKLEDIQKCTQRYAHTVYVNKKSPYSTVITQ